MPVVLRDHACRLCTDADALVDGVESHRRDLDRVITDIAMGGPKSGIEAAVEIRDRFPALPGLVFSQHIQPSWALGTGS